MSENKTLSANTANVKCRVGHGSRTKSRVRDCESSNKKRVLGYLLPLLAVLPFILPSPYVIEKPGMALNTLGTLKIDDSEKMIVTPAAAVADSSPNTGKLNLLTVTIAGNKDYPRAWGTLLGALFDPSQDIVPVNVIFPENLSVDEVKEHSNQLMQGAQNTAAAVALQQLGHKVQSKVVVMGAIAGSDAANKLLANDTILSVNGVDIATEQQLVDQIQLAAGNPVKITLQREPAAEVRQQDTNFDAEREIEAAQTETSAAPGTAAQIIEVTVNTYQAENGKYLLGVYPAAVYDLPYSFEYAVDDIGGPSAGLIFTLALIDKMSAADLTGGANVSATGTIEANGKVGAIGGLKQKLYAAERVGTDLFLFPQDNCEQLPEKIPGKMTLVAVDNISEALAALQAYREGRETAGIAACNRFAN